MYSIGIFANISELTTFPFANIKRFAEVNFLQKDNCEFYLYTKDQKELFLAKVQTCEFDGIIFATNTANDATLKEYFENNAEVFSKFLAAGKGILILLQYHLAIANSFFNILLEKDFPGLSSIQLKTKQNNDANNAPIAFNKDLIKCHNGEIFFHYPREVLNGETDYNFYNAMQANKWQTGSSPLFAYIDSYPEGDFYSIIDYDANDVDNQKSFCIVSRNANKRVIITTLALDLEENFLLENLVSYIAMGEPSVFFQECGACSAKGGTCDFVDLLYNTKIHFSGDEQIKSLVKYEVLNCKALKSIIVNNKTTEESESTIPIKQLMPVNSSGGQISRCVNVSSVRYMCKLGAQFLCTQLSNGKYGSLIGTLTTLKFFKEINLTIQDDDKRSILEYLKAHNKDVSTFDAVRESTRLASEILKLLNYDGSAIRFNSEAKREFERILITIDYLETLEINRIAEIFGDESFIIDSLSSDDKEIKEFLLKIFAKIISSRDIGKISWENDCYMTALMLLVLLKIEKWLIKYDAKYHSNCVNKINVIAAYFEEISETSLYNALVNSANSERSKAHDFVLKLQDERKKREKLDSEIVALKEEKRDFESIENRVRQHQTINIILAFSIVSILVFCLVIVLRAHYSNDNIYDFLMGLQPISIIFSVAAVIVVPFTIGTIYWKSNKKKSQSVKKESFWERIKKKFKRKK